MTDANGNPTPEELQQMGPEERVEYQQRILRERKWCHRAFRNHVVAFPVPAGGGIATPGGPQGMELRVQGVPANQMCERENCMMWDPRGDNGRGCCLDRSVAVAISHGRQTVVTLKPDGPRE